MRKKIWLHHWFVLWSKSTEVIIDNINSSRVCNGLSDFELWLLSTQYTCALGMSIPLLHSIFRKTDTAPQLKDNLAHIKTHVLEGHVEWSAIIRPTQQALAVLEDTRGEILGE